MKKASFAIVLALCAASAFASIRAVSHDMYGGKADAWQLKRHAEKMNVVTNGGAKVVFVGDSITHFWETNGKEQLAKYYSEGDRKMLDLGISADRTEHVLWRLNEGGELDGYEAKCVLLMIGTNNTGHFPIEQESPGDTILGIREILKTGWTGPRTSPRASASSSISSRRSSRTRRRSSCRFSRSGRRRRTPSA